MASKIKTLGTVKRCGAECTSEYSPCAPTGGCDCDVPDSSLCELVCVSSETGYALPGFPITATFDDWNELENVSITWNADGTISGSGQWNRSTAGALTSAVVVLKIGSDVIAQGSTGPVTAAGVHPFSFDSTVSGLPKAGAITAQVFQGTEAGPSESLGNSTLGSTPGSSCSAINIAAADATPYGFPQTRSVNWQINLTGLQVGCSYLLEYDEIDNGDTFTVSEEFTATETTRTLTGSVPTPDVGETNSIGNCSISRLPCGGGPGGLPGP